MYSYTTRSCAYFAIVLSMSLTLATLAPAATITIQFSGMNLLYDGSSIYDAGSMLGGNLNPAEADPLTAAVFYVDGSPVGELTQLNGDSLALDAFIPDVTGIPVGPGVYNQVTPGNPGFFDLLFGSPVATEYLQLDLADVLVTYVDALTVQFTFGASVASIAGANLPFGLLIGDPVDVSFSALIAPGSVTNNGTFITGFTAAGTGEVSGPQVPEPSTGILAALGLVAGLAYRGWNRRR